MNRLHFWRLERRLSQYELANAAGVPRWAIQLSEQTGSEMKPEHQQLVALALGCAVEEVFPKLKSKFFKLRRGAVK